MLQHPAPFFSMTTQLVTGAMFTYPFLRPYIYVDCYTRTNFKRLFSHVLQVTRNQKRCEIGASQSRLRSKFAIGLSDTYRPSRRRKRKPNTILSAAQICWTKGVWGTNAGAGISDTEGGSLEEYPTAVTSPAPHLPRVYTICTFSPFTPSHECNQ